MPRWVYSGVVSVPETWIEHRRGDGELVGWMEQVGDDFRLFDLLGRERTDAPITWLLAEELLEDLGIGYLADPYAFEMNNEWIRVKIVEVTPERIVVKCDDFGDVTADLPTYELTWPATGALVPLDEAPGPVRTHFG